jgi:hypothetical protein
MTKYQCGNPFKKSRGPGYPRSLKYSRKPLVQRRHNMVTVFKPIVFIINYDFKKIGARFGKLLGAGIIQSCGVMIAAHIERFFAF